MENSLYIEYINTHVEEIAEYVNSFFEKRKNFIRARLIREKRKFIESPIEHYVWKSDGNKYDHSGILVEDGYVSLDQTVTDFLENEYTGGKNATHMSGMGWSYPTYGDDLSYLTIELGSELMFAAIKNYLENSFSIVLSDQDFLKIQEECCDFDEIYDNCKASDFFSAELAIEFVGIGNLRLIDIMLNIKTHVRRYR